MWWPFSKEKKESTKKGEAKSPRASKSIKVKTLADYLLKHDSATGAFNHNKDDLNILFNNFENHLRKDVKYGSNNVPSLQELKQKWAKGKFWYADLSKTNLRNAHLIGLDFSYVNFEKARLSNCHFSGSVFISAYFTGTMVRHCDFDKTEFYKTEFTATRFTRCDFKQAKLTHCKFRQCYVIHSKLIGGIFGWTTLIGCKFQQNDIKDYKWFSVRFNKTVLTKNDFTRLNARSLIIDDKSTIKGGSIKQSLFCDSSLYATIEQTHIVKSSFIMHTSVHRLASSNIKETVFKDGSIKSSFNNTYKDTVFARLQLGGLMKDTLSKCTLYNVLLHKGPQILSTTFDDCKIAKGGSGSTSKHNQGVFDKVTYVNCVISDESYCGYRLSSLEYKNCVLVDVSFSESELKDSIFDKSTALYWSYFLKCKLSGVSFKNTSDTAYVKLGLTQLSYNGKLAINDSVMGPIIDSYKLRSDHETYYLLDVPTAKQHYNRFDGKWSKMQGSDEHKLDSYIKQQLGSTPSKLKAVQAYHKSVKMVESGHGMFHSIKQWYNVCNEHPEKKTVAACMKPFNKYCDSFGHIPDLHYVSNSNPSDLSMLGNPPAGF